MSYNMTRGVPKRVVELLKDGNARTSPEIADELAVDPSNMAEIMRGLKELDKVHVHEWPRDTGGHAVRAWIIGAGKDAPKPVAMTKNQLKQLARARQKAQRQAPPRNAVPHRHIHDVWLFGEYSGASA